MGNPPADLRRAVALAAAGTPLLWISLESAHEAAALAGLVRAARGRRGVDPTVRLDCLVRLNPAVRPETQHGLAVGAGGSEVGGLAAALGRGAGGRRLGLRAAGLEGVIAAGGGPDGPLRWRGIHVHVGSQLGAVDAWRGGFPAGVWGRRGGRG